MSGINKVTIIGNLGNDPETKVFSNGGMAVKFSVATSESWTDKQTGEKREVTEWHNIDVQNNLAKVAQQYLKKGSKVYLEGKLRTRKYTDKNGIERYTTDIILNGYNSVLQMLDRNPNAPVDATDGEKAPF
jgi:single-strand DNA-binding protein